MSWRTRRFLIRRARQEGANSMNAFIVIAGLSGLAVFCFAALKGFGAAR